MAKEIPISSIEGLRQELDSIVAVEHRYTDIDAMILAAAQATQEAGQLMQVDDATADANVVTGSAYYDYTGAATESIDDYFLVSAPQSAALGDGEGTVANGIAVDLASDTITSDLEWVRIVGDNNFGTRLVNGESGNYVQNFVTKIRNEFIARADIAYQRSIDNDNSIGAAVHTTPLGEVIISNSVGGYTFIGFRYGSDYPGIDWETDPNEGLLIPHQDRVQAMIDASGAGSGVVVLNEYYVAKTGLDTNNGSVGLPFLTIQAAIDVAPTGIRSNIYIDEGIYADEVAINKPVQLIGMKGSGRFDVLTEIGGQLTTTVAGIILNKLKLPAASPNTTSFDVVISCTFSTGSMRGKYYNCLMPDNITAFTDANNEWHDCIFEGNFDLSSGKIYNTTIEGNLIHDGVADLSLYSTTVKGNFTQNGSTLNLYGSHLNGSIGGTAVNIINHDKASQIFHDDTVSALGVDDIQSAIDIHSSQIIGTESDLLTHASGDGTDHGNVVLNDSHRLGDGSDHPAVAINSGKNSYPPADAAKLLTIEENAKDHIPPVHLDDYADEDDMVLPANQVDQIVGHPYKTLDDENWQYLRTKGIGIAGYDGGGNIEVPVAISMSDYETDIEAGTGKGYWLALFDCTIQSVIGGLVVEAPVGATAIFDLNKNGTTMMTTDKIQIESGNKHSINSTTQPVLTTTAILKGDIISGDIDVTGGTTKGKGAQITFIVIR